MSKYVKFTSECVTAEAPSFTGLADLNAYRRKLLNLGLIGTDGKGVGFGNLSVREGATNNFHVTGSATAAKFALTLSDCAKVVTYDFARNSLQYEGSAIPSSESLTHASIYECDVNAGAVIHCHDLEFWAAILNRVPTTSKTAQYGTPAMAYEVLRLFRDTDLPSEKILAMAGHDGGIVTFGRDLKEAFAVLMRERDHTSPCVRSAFHEGTSA